MSVDELKVILDEVDDDYEVIIGMRHNYPISKESGEKGWIAYIGGVEIDKECKTVKLMNS